jgi:hypothetical protein
VNLFANCNEAILLQCGDNGIYDTRNGKNNYGKTDYLDCYNGPSLFNGNDVLFKIVKTDYKMWTISIFNNSNMDIDMFLLDNCFGGGLGKGTQINPITCLDKSINGVNAVYSGYNYDAISISNPGTYYLVVDGYNQNQNGQFNINVGCDDFVQDDFLPCINSYEQLECNIIKSGFVGCKCPPGTICICDQPKMNNYSCLPEKEKGSMTSYENIFSFTADIDGEYLFEISELNQNLDLFIISNYCDPQFNGISDYNCIALSTNQGKENESITLEMKQNQTVYIVVDGHLGATSEYKIFVKCAGPCDAECCVFPSSFSKCYTFEDYLFLNIFPQGNPDFSVIGNSNVNNAQIVNTEVKRGSKSAKFSNNSNIDLNINRNIAENKPTRLEWWMYIPSGKSSLWHIKTNNVSISPILMEIKNGIGKIGIGNILSPNFIDSFPVKNDKWIKHVLIFQPDENEIEFWFDGQFIYKESSFQSNRVGQLNFSNKGINTEYYVDEICYSEFNPLIKCSEESSPVCYNGKTYKNQCFAFFKGYTLCENRCNDLNCDSQIELFNEDFNKNSNSSYGYDNGDLINKNSKWWKGKGAYVDTDMGSIEFDSTLILLLNNNLSNNVKKYKVSFNLFMNWSRWGIPPTLGIDNGGFCIADENNCLFTLDANELLKKISSDCLTGGDLGTCFAKVDILIDKDNIVEIFVDGSPIEILFPIGGDKVNKIYFNGSIDLDDVVVTICDPKSNVLECVIPADLSILDDFEDYTLGYIVPQGSPKYTLNFNNEISQAEVINFQDSKVLNFSNASNIKLNLNRPLNFTARLEWLSFIKNGKAGSWGINTNSSRSNVTFIHKNNVVTVIYRTAQNGQFIKNSETIHPKDKWFKTVLIFNSLESTIEIWQDNKLVYSINDFIDKQVFSLNLFGDISLTNNEFLIDNIKYCEISSTCTCTSEYNPVCVNGKEFSNACKARCAGYTENEWTQGPCDGSGGSTILVFDIDDNVCGPVSQIVNIPVKVKGFSRISSFQFTINIPDNSKGEIIGIEKGNIAGDLNFGLISPSTATVVWDNTAPIDLTDNTVVINIKVRIKSLFSGSTDINIVGTPTDISADQNGQTVKPSVIKGSFCATSSSHKICGKITREDNTAVPNVIVTLSGGKNATVTTNTNGEYSFENLDANLTYIIRPSKNTNHVNGVNTGDVTAIRRHILALEKLDSPYKIIAADASKSNAVNTGDVTEIRRLILALISQFSTTESWAFVPKSHVFTNPTNPFASAIPNTITINGLSNDQGNQDFVGIKVGDVNLSNNPSNLDGILENRNRADINLIVSSANVVGNQDFDIDISVRQFNEITSGQFSVNWSSDLANFISLKNLNPTLGLTNDNFNATQTATGKLGFIWDSPTLINLPDDSKLFTISFKAKSNGIVIVNITDDPVGKYFEDKDKKEVNVVVTNGSITVPTEEKDLTDTKIKIFPNPTTGIISIESDFNDVKNIEIRSFDGSLIQEISVLKDKKLDLTHLSPGSYVFKGFVNNYPFAKKLVIIKY